MIGTTITQFLIEEQRRIPTATGDLTSVINDIVTACKTIAGAMRYGAITNEGLLDPASTTNAQGEEQKRLDVVGNQLFLQCTEFGGHVAAMVSEEMESIHQLPGDSPAGRYLLLYDPVDGSFNINENATIGTIFSILRRPEGAAGRPALEEFLQSGSEQVVAGYALYGPSCMMVMTTGSGVNGFTLDPMVGEFILTHPAMTIAAKSDRLYANAGWLHEWDEPFRSYVSDRLNATGASAGRPVDLRWSRCAVADVHRVLMSGGIYVTAANAELRDAGHEGVLRLLYEVSPLAFIVEQAGGQASSVQGRILDIPPRRLHQRSAAVMGAGEEVRFFIEKYRD